MAEHNATSTTEVLTLAFHVPTGLEDYARLSLLLQLSHHLSPCDLQYSAPLHSSHVLIRFPTPSLLRQSISLYLSRSLWAAYDAYLLLSPLSLDDVRPTLESEYWVRHRATGKKARENQQENIERKLRLASEGEASAQREKQQMDGRQPPAEPPTPGEEALMSHLSSLITSNFPSLEQALTHLPPNPKTFRATFSNPSRLLPLSTLHRQGIERTLGESLSLHFKRDKWSVKLVDPEVDLHLRLLPSSLSWTSHHLPTSPPLPALEKEPQAFPAFPPALSALLCLALPSPAVPAHRLPPLEGPTPLSPPIAHLLCLMLPSISGQPPPPTSPALPPSASPTPTQPSPSPASPTPPAPAPSPIIFDPCAGLGSIPRELAALSSPHSPFPSSPVHSLAGDDHLPSLLSTLLTPSLSGSALHYSALHPLPLRPGVLGGFVTDLPWGTRHLSPSKLSALYPALLRRLAVAVERGGWGVVMTAARGSMEGALKGGRRWWSREGCREVRVGGRAVWVWVVRRL